MNYHIHAHTLITRTYHNYNFFHMENHFFLSIEKVKSRSASKGPKAASKAEQLCLQMKTMGMTFPSQVAVISPPPIGSYAPTIQDSNQYTTLPPGRGVPTGPSALPKCKMAPLCFRRPLQGPPVKNPCRSFAFGIHNKAPKSPSNGKAGARIPWQRVWYENQDRQDKIPRVWAAGIEVCLPALASLALSPVEAGTI